MASSVRARVASLTPGRPAATRETAETETPAARATSRMLGRAPDPLIDLWPSSSPTLIRHSLPSLDSAGRARSERAHRCLQYHTTAATAPFTERSLKYTKRSALTKLRTYSRLLPV